MDIQKLFRMGKDIKTLIHKMYKRTFRNRFKQLDRNSQVHILTDRIR